MVQQVSKKISELTALTTAAAALYFPATVGGSTYKVQPHQVTNYFNVRLYGAVGDGTTDDRAAILAALAAAVAAGGGVLFFQPGTYAISARVTLSSNIAIEGVPGAVIKLRNSANTFCLTIGVGASNVAIRNIEIDGNKANNASGAAGIQSEDNTSENISIEDVFVHDCAAAGIYMSGSYVRVASCTSVDNGVEGITGANLDFFEFVDNFAARNGTHNVGLIGTCTFGLIEGNVCEDSGALADNLTGYGASNSHVTWANNVSRRGGNNGAHVGGSYITFNNNVIEDATDYGLIARNNDASAMPGFQASGNIISNSGTAAESGVWLGNLIDFTWGPNIVRSSRAHGLLIQEGCTRGSVTGGTYSNNGTSGSGSGVRIEDSTDINVTGVTVAGNASVGLRIQDSTRINVSGGGGPTNASPVTVDGTSTLVTIVGFNCLSNTSDTPTLTAGCVSLWADSPNGGTVNVASAGTIAAMPYSDYFRVTGTTNITSITGGWNGRRITLRFTGALTMVTGGNLIIGGGTYTSASNSTLTLIYDGTNWYETGRMSP